MATAASACPHLDFIKAQPHWSLALAFVGVLVLLRAAFKFLIWFYVFFVRPAKPLRRRYGQWAVVTGATDGIGLAIAGRLSAAGLNLVLIGRNPDKLAQASGSILAKSPKSIVHTLVLDFAADNLADGIAKLEKEILGLDVGILVNCAGISYPYARYFHEVDDELLTNLIRVNVDAMTRVTRAVIPGMVERKRGAIINIGSGAATVIPSDPLYAVYAATKAYVDQFSRCLYVEYKGKGIDVQCQVPLYVATKMASIRKSSFLVPSAEQYARACIRHIGYEATCTPYWPHSVLWGLISLLPESIVDSWRLKMCLGIQKKGQAKDARKKNQ